MAFFDLFLLPGAVLNTLDKLAHMVLSLTLNLVWIQEGKKEAEISAWDSYNIASEKHFIKNQLLTVEAELAIERFQRLKGQETYFVPIITLRLSLNVTLFGSALKIVEASLGNYKDPSQSFHILFKPKEIGWFLSSFLSSWKLCGKGYSQKGGEEIEWICLFVFLHLLPPTPPALPILFSPSTLTIIYYLNKDQNCQGQNPVPHLIGITSLLVTVI